MLKTIIFLIFFAVTALDSITQPMASSPVAPFNIKLVNGKSYTYTNLQKAKATVIIYFSPTCGHCIDFTKELIRHPKQFADKQIVMVTIDPIDEVKRFIDLHGLAAFSNIKIGIEGSPFIIRHYYNVQHFPFIASYNKQGKLTNIIAKEMKPEDLVRQL